MIKKRKKTNLYSFKRVLLSKKSYAKKFAGRNMPLYNLLIACFDHKIETVKCNPGIEYKSVIKKPYITFRINANNEKYVERLIYGLEKKNIIITFSFNHLGHKTITIKTLEDSNEVFSKIQDLLFCNVDKKDCELAEVYAFVRTQKGKNTNIKLLYDEDAVHYYVNTEDDNIIGDIEKKLFPKLEEGKIKLNVLG